MAAGLVQQRRRRNAALIGVSVLAHLVIFAIIGLNVPKLAMRFQPPQATNIWLMPHLNLRTAKEKSRAAAPSAFPTPAQTTPSKPQAAQSPSPLAAAPALVSQGAAPAVGTPGAAENGAGVVGALRTSIGCDIGRLAHLTPEEKDRCNQRIGEEAHKGPKFIDTIPPKKREYYDAVQQASQAAHDPAHPFVRDRYGNVQALG